MPTSAQRFVELLTAAFARAPIEDASLDEDERARLVRARALFLAGGAEAVTRQLGEERWAQIAVTFTDDDARARFVDQSLRDLVEPAFTAGVISGFFFLYKPPGLRLRFLGPRSAWLEEDVDALLARARDAGRLNAFRHELYDAESFIFGGPSGLDAFHAFSTADSRAVLALAADAASHPDDALDPMLASLFVTGALARGVADDRFEAWDVWCNLALAGRVIPNDARLRASLDEELDANRAVLAAAVAGDLDALEPGPSERAELARLADAAREATARLRAAGDLLAPPRKIVPFIMVHHWNRRRFDEATQLRLTHFAQSLTDPRR